MPRTFLYTSNNNRINAFFSVKENLIVHFDPFDLELPINTGPKYSSNDPRQRWWHTRDKEREKIYVICRTVLEPTARLLTRNEETVTLRIARNDAGPIGTLLLLPRVNRQKRSRYRQGNIARKVFALKPLRMT